MVRGPSEVGEVSGRDRATLSVQAPHTVAPARGIRINGKFGEWRRWDLNPRTSRLQVPLWLCALHGFVEACPVQGWDVRSVGLSQVGSREGQLGGVALTGPLTKSVLPCTAERDTLGHAVGSKAEPSRTSRHRLVRSVSEIPGAGIGRQRCSRTSAASTAGRPAQPMGRNL